MHGDGEWWAIPIWIFHNTHTSVKVAPTAKIWSKLLDKDPVSFQRTVLGPAPSHPPFPVTVILKRRRSVLLGEDWRFPPAVVERAMWSAPKRYQDFLHWPPWKPALLWHPERSISNQPTDTRASAYITRQTDTSLFNVLSNLTKTSLKLGTMAAQVYQVQICRAEGLLRCIQRGTPTRVSKEEKTTAQQPGKLITYPRILWALLSLTPQC